LASTLLGHDPYRIIVPPGHRLARRRELELADLAGERFSGPYREAGGYREMLDRLCAQAGFEPDVTYVVNDVTVGRAFVAAGVCVALMSELGIQQPRPDVIVKPVRGLDPMRSVHASWLRGRRSPAIAPMVELLVEAAAARLGQP
jgi:DNA-binding transcriptional LysR family regulator